MGIRKPNRIPLRRSPRRLRESKECLLQGVTTKANRKFWNVIRFGQKVKKKKTSDNGFDNPLYLGNSGVLPMDPKSNVTHLFQMAVNSLINKLEDEAAARKLLENEVKTTNKQLEEVQQENKILKQTMNKQLEEVQQENKTLKQTTTDMATKLEEATKNIESLQQIVNDMPKTMNEAIANMMSKYETQNQCLNQKVDDVERTLSAQKNEETQTHAQIYDKLSQVTNTIEHSSKTHQEEIQKVAGTVKRLKRKPNKVSVHIKEARVCQVNTGAPGVLVNGESDVSSGESSCQTDSTSSASERETASSIGSSSPSDLSPDDDAEPEESRLRQCSRNDAYTNPSEAVWNDLQNLDTFDETPLDDYLEPIDEGREQTRPKTVFQDTVTETHTDQDSDTPTVSKKLTTGQIYEGFLALSTMLQACSFTATASLPDAYMKMVDNIIAFYGSELPRFLDTVRIPLYTIPADVSQGGDRAVIAHAVYTWCCQQTGPAATDASLIHEMAAILAGFRPGINYGIQVHEEREPAGDDPQYDNM